MSNSPSISANTGAALQRLLLCLACAMAVTGTASAQVSEVVLHNFVAPPKGAYPVAGVIRSSANDLYGTTTNGGTDGFGAVYKLDSRGHQTVLYNFTGGPDGGYPYAGLAADSNGNFYGTTEEGGNAGYGVVYKFSTTGGLTVLYSSTGGTDGGYPMASVTRDSAGNLYGTATYGGTTGNGVVFELTAAGSFMVLHNFTAADGAFPNSSVSHDAAGNLYGTTKYGGMGWGVLYKLDIAGELTVIHSFTNGKDGGSPYGGVTRDAAGNLYGTTNSGGASFAGTVYKLDSAGNMTVLCNLEAIGGVGSYAGVTRDSAGNLYGTTYYGGAAYGLVYKVDTAGNLTNLYTFTGAADGGHPYAGVILDAAGNLYGTTQYGGTAGLGVVFKVDTAGHETVLCSFPGALDGFAPAGALIRDSAGSLYGTTGNGGPAGGGVVFKVDTKGQETVLHTFNGSPDGFQPKAGVTRDSAGNLYGTTYSGGAASNGTVFKVDTTGVETVLYSFTGMGDGGSPQGGVILDTVGNLFGTTRYGGTAGVGVVYKLDTSGHETVLYNFSLDNDGRFPNSTLTEDPTGNYYGTTEQGGSLGAGTVFELNKSGHETVLYNFTGASDGGYPLGGVVRDSAGNLYGATNGGGINGQGIVYKVDASFHQTVLYAFPGGASGQYPFAGVILDAAGNLYGTTELGGNGAGGVVFKLDADGQETVLYDFPGIVDGNRPLGPLTRDAAGNLYGTASAGGKRNGGVVFKLRGAAAAE